MRGGAAAGGAERALAELRGEFRALVERLTAEHPYLPALQAELKRELGYEDYELETPIVYNEALDAPADESRAEPPAFILVADNPGKKEQLARNRRYLVGQSGKLAEGFFARELGIDFRSRVIILNKTPVHTPKTAELRRLLVLAGPKGSPRRESLEGLLAESQEAMAGMARRLHGALGRPLWISGMGELGPRGLFAPYARALGAAYEGAPDELRDSVLLFSHFSMNRFAIEYRGKADPRLGVLDNLLAIGRANRRRVLGW